MIEELLAGEEVSIFALADGRGVVPLVTAAQDFKRIGDGDTGPNTGGMGSYSPVPGMDADEGRSSSSRSTAGRRGARPAGVAVHRRAVRRADADRLRAEGARVQLPFRRPRDAVDPAAAGGRPPRRAGRCRRRRARRCRARRGRGRRRHRRLAAGDYPERSDTGSEIAGIEDAEADGALVFHAGTALRGDRLVTNGGRILGVTGTGTTIGEARDRAYAGCERITFAGARYRSDIALSASGRPPEVRRSGR